MLRGLLLQLLKKRRNLFKHIQDDYKQNKKSLFNDFDVFWATLLNMLEDPKAGQIYLLIDALDECENSSRQDLLNLLAEDLLEKELNVKVLVTCRLEPSIEEAFHHHTGYLCIDSGKVNDNLSKYICYKVNELSARKNYLLVLKQDVEEAHINGVGGTFLWASLVLDDISRTRLMAHVRKKLQALPSSLGEVCNRILDNVDDECADVATLILECVVARRPLTVDE